MQRLEYAPTVDQREARLIGRIAGGDRDALTELYHQYQRALFRYLTQLTPDRGLAEEILQDTLVAAWRSAGSFEGRSQLRTWLFGIARRQAHNAFRRHSLPVMDEADLTEVADPAVLPEDQALARAQLQELSEAIGRLSLLHREVLALAFVNGLSYEEMARVLEVPEGTVKSRLSNARRALRLLMEGPRDDADR